MSVEALISTQVIDTTTVGRALMTAVDASGARTTLGLGSLATQSGTFSGTSSGTNTGDQTIALTGDVTGTGTGSFVATIGALKVTNAMLAGSIAASNLVGTDIATLGTVTAGTLSTGAVIAGVTITVGSDATGDLHYRNASGVFTRLGIGSAAQVLTVTGGLPSWAASSGLSGTGAVDNAVLRADGTGGATLQSSAFTIADLATASPNNTVNNVSMAPTGGTTNVSVSIVPKGTGAFCLAVPNGTSAGGNARGANAVDLQTSRTAATQVASGAKSFVFSNQLSLASGESSVAGCYGSQSSGFGSWAFGQQVVSSGYYTAAWGSTSVSGAMGFGIGLQGTVSGRAAFGLGTNCNAYLMNSIAVGTFAFAANGDNQVTVAFPMSGSTVDATPVELLSKEAFGPTTSRASIPTNTSWSFEILILARKSSGADHARYNRSGLIYKNTTNATTTIEGSVQIVGTDIISAGASSWAVSVTADTTNGALKIEFTGAAATNIRVSAWVRMVEVGYS